MIYLIRHGQTEYNAVRRFQGGKDSPLTALGVAQARAMGLALRGMIDPATVALFSSPRGRTLETAQFIAEEAGIQVAPIVDDGLAEISLGSWDGLTVDEIDMRWPGQWQKLGRQTWHFETPDGERYDSFEARLAASLARITAHPAPVRIVVSHGVASRVLRGLHADLPREEALALAVPQGVIYRLDRGTVSEIDCTHAIV